MDALFPLAFSNSTVRGLTSEGRMPAPPALSAAGARLQNWEPPPAAPYEHATLMQRHSAMLAARKGSLTQTSAMNLLNKPTAAA